MSTTSSSTTYEEEEKLLESYQDNASTALEQHRPRTWQQGLKNRIPWLLHFLAAVLYTAIFLRFNALSNTKNFRLLHPTEVPSAAGAVRYETVRFNATDWSGATRPNKFEGPPNPERDAAWESIVDVGMYSLTKEEYEMFPPGIVTAQVATHPEDHVVLIEMFHQLHCLHMFRSLIYHVGDENVYHENPQQVPLHIDHCLDYMRQTIMCHGDLTPLLLTYQPQGGPSYFPDFSSPRTCRNFDSIYEWALKGNRSGKHLEF